MLYAECSYNYFDAYMNTHIPTHAYVYTLYLRPMSIRGCIWHTCRTLPDVQDDQCQAAPNVLLPSACHFCACRARRGNSHLAKSRPYAGLSAGAEVARLPKWHVWCLLALVPVPLALPYCAARDSWSSRPHAAPLRRPIHVYIYIYIYIYTYLHQQHNLYTYPRDAGFQAQNL